MMWGRNVEAREWLDEFWGVDEEVMWYCCWKKGWMAYVAE